MTNSIHRNKTNPFKLSEQVKNILNSKGYTAIFNFSDYYFFKSLCKKAFHPAYAIAELFIKEADPNQNNFNQYIF